ncbi:MAG: protein kinase, partial [Methylococcaceae bacterium]|nr:protein kinase [Methylococcaceae bacterium]
MTEPILEELPTATQLASYRIIRLIGCGGFAYTYLVENNERQRFVLKELFPCGIMVRNHDGSIGLHSSQTEELEIWQSAVNNFCTEARVLRQINIPSIPQLVDTFQANNTYYIVQEWILGESLEKIGVNLPTNQREDKITFVEHLLHSLLDTLKAIHNEGILHRDIKPANIMIQDSDRSPILIDFGGVRLQIGGVTRNFNERIWSLGYSSPEQLSTQGIEQTQSSDLYSLAACFYFLLFNTK